VKYYLLSFLLFFSSNSIPLFSQIITTVAGGATGHGGYWGDGGYATACQLNSVPSVALDTTGNIFIAAKDRILKVNVASGIISTIAGTGVLGYNGDNIPATNAQLNWATVVAFDAIGNLYIADGENYRIRKIDVTTGVISTYAGNGVLGSSGDGGPATAASFLTGWIHFDIRGNLYIGDRRKIRKVAPSGIITTFAGTGLVGVTGENVPATSTTISSPLGISSDVRGNVYFADTTGAIRKINASNGFITRVAGTGDNIRNPFSGDGTSATSCHIAPIGLAIDYSGNIYIADGNNYRIEQVNANATINTVAGSGISGYVGDNGSPTLAKLNLPQGITLDTCGNLYIADFGNNVVRKVTFPHCHYLRVTEPNSYTNISTFPNPAHDFLNAENIYDKTEYIIFNTIGQVMRQGVLKPGSNIISLNLLPAGIYLLELIDESKQRIVKKVIKQ
jgi:hypothetical protein